MSFRRPFRRWSVLASVLAAAGTVLTVAGCSHLAPLGPDQPAATRKMPPPRSQVGPVPNPQPSLLRSPFVLEAVRIQAPARAGRCPAGSVALSGGPGQCYRKVGRPVTITVAGISPIEPYGPPGSVQDTFFIAVTASGRPALMAVTQTAFDSHGFLDISIAGRTWLLPRVDEPFTQPEFEITLPRTTQTLQLHRLLDPSA